MLEAHPLGPIPRKKTLLRQALLLAAAVLLVDMYRSFHVYKATSCVLLWLSCAISNQPHLARPANHCHTTACTLMMRYVLLRITG